jgi:ferritin
MINEKLQDALNDQMNFELYSGYIYLSMSANFEAQNMPGFASWMFIQWQEEFAHAMKFFHYIGERGGKVELRTIRAPDGQWPSALDAFETALHHERIVTGRFNDLVALARAENDQATYNFLQWFIDEQVEEEATADGIVQQLKMMGDFGPGLLMIDRELAARTFTPPAP